MIRYFAAAVFALWALPAVACPGSASPCITFPAFTNGAPAVTAPAPSDRIPYVQGAATKYTAAVATLTGVAGDGTTDVTAAIQAQINGLPSGGVLQFPVGHYCVKTGPLVVVNPGVTLLGQNKGSNGTGAVPLIDACGADVALLVMSGAGDLVQQISFKGSQVPNTVNDTIALNAGCVECTLNFVGAKGGRYAISATDAYEIYLLNASADSTYGNAIVYLHAVSGSIGGYITKGKFDQAYPFATPAAGSVGASVPAWASSHSYTAGQIVAANGYNLQATIGGTSGGSAPATPPYGTTTVDGGVSWGLVGKTGNYGVLCDGANCGSELDVGQSDFSGDESVGFGAINSAHGIVLHENTFGSNLVNNVLVSGSYGMQIHDSIFGGGLATIGTAISFAFAGDDNFVHHNWIIQGGPASGATGVYMDGNNIIADGNICSVATCFSVPANVTDFNIENNSCFSGFGASTTCVFVAPGTSDYYNIIGNNAHGATTSISDGGTGTHKVVLDSANMAGGVAFNDNKINEHLSVLPINAPTIASGFGTGPAPPVGSDSSGHVVVGSGGAASGSILFGTPWLVGTAPECWAQDYTTGNIMKPAPNSTNLVIAGTMVAGDTIGWGCTGHN